MYSSDYRLLTNAIDGTCSLDTSTGYYSCGAPGCNPSCTDYSPDQGSPGRYGTSQSLAQVGLLIS